MQRIFIILFIVLFTFSCEQASDRQAELKPVNERAVYSENEFTGKFVGFADEDTATVLDERNR